MLRRSCYLCVLLLGLVEPFVVLKSLDHSLPSVLSDRLKIVIGILVAIERLSCGSASSRTPCNAHGASVYQHCSLLILTDRLDCILGSVSLQPSWLYHSCRSFTLVCFPTLLLQRRNAVLDFNVRKHRVLGIAAWVKNLVLLCGQVVGLASPSLNDQIFLNWAVIELSCFGRLSDGWRLNVLWAILDDNGILRCGESAWQLISRHVQGRLSLDLTFQFFMILRLW